MSRAAASGPLVIGLTGSIGMGKSTVAAMLRDEGVPLFDADAAVHLLQGQGGALVGAIEAEFPGSTHDGAVDRRKLGAMVLGQPERLRALEAIVHPAVAAERAAFLAANAHAALVCLDIPLLFETGLQDSVDLILVVSAPRYVQRARVLARPGMDEARFAAIEAQQLPDADKRARADVVIDTGTSLAETRDAVRALVRTLRKDGPKALA